MDSLADRMASTDEATLGRSLTLALGAEKVRTDEGSRHAYSTDASPCAVEPRAVVFAASEADVLAVLRVCRDLRIPLTPRASGTSLSGAAIGPGVVLDTTRFNRIIGFDATRQCVTVQPGILLAELNAYLAERGVRIAPDPGSQDLCRIGGMVGHNASGYRSVKYGQTRDHVLSLRVALLDGTVLTARDLMIDGPEWKQATKQSPCLERVRAEIEGHREAILSSRRPIRKHSCGYDLATIADSLSRGIFPLAGLFVGSEGTLGIVTEVTLRVLPIPPRRVTVLLYLDRFGELGPLVADLLALSPSAMEAIDGASLDLIGREVHGVPAGAEVMLLVEFDEGDLDAVVATVVGTIASRYRLSRTADVAEDAQTQAGLWKLRRSVFRTIIQRPGARKAWGFVEDPIVPRDRVPEFIEFLVGLTQRHATVAGIYGHIGDGNTHYRPLFDPTDPADFERMRALREEFDDAVLDRFHGAPSGEHGIGRLRAETLPRVWGREVYEVMRATKKAFDPQGLLNPGVLFSDAPWWASWGGLESRTPM
ncbi:MAG: FAD-binding oxidoreductase [Methanobacteriota archaeon]|nr:MAG: FAD-binding oxidoreductase [Euryarchaeota archaeon]